jgi:hypothetical protein
MFRVGIVKTQDVANCRVRVTFSDLNQLQSWWLPVVTPKSTSSDLYQGQGASLVTTRQGLKMVPGGCVAAISALGTACSFCDW